MVLAFAATFYISKSERDSIGYTPEQPIKFSHKLHAGEMRIDCKYCHYGATKSRHALVPDVATCMNCHSIARIDKSEIIKLTKYYKNSQPLLWKRVHRLPDFVYFNHSSHVNKGIDCIRCHGDVAGMEAVGQVNLFTMGACLNCHRNAIRMLPKLATTIKNGPEHCSACHR